MTIRATELEEGGDGYAALVRIVERIDRDRVLDHERLRKDVTALEALAATAAREREALRLEVERVKATRVEAGELVAAPRTVSAILVIVLSIVSSVSAGTWIIRSTFLRIEAKIETAAEIQAVKDAAAAARDAQITKSIDEMRRRTELQQYESQQLKEAVLSSSRSRR
jgi:hypothetical protein